MRRSPRKLLLLLPLGLALTLGLLGIAPPGAEQEAPVASAPPELQPSARSPMAGYEPLRAGHPLRLVAYALHPVGVILDYVVCRPLYWISSHEPLRTLFGHES
jgi:hypothetical protein